MSFFQGFDIIPLPSGGYDLVAGTSFLRVEFSDEEEKKLFDILIKNRNKSIRDIIKILLKECEKPRLYEFFLKLRDASLIWFDDNEGLFSGRTYSAEEAARYHIEKSSWQPPLILGDSPLIPHLKNIPAFKKARFASANPKRMKDLARMLSEHPFAIIDASSYNPAVLEEINRVRIEQEKPWLLVQGIFDGALHIGPLFYPPYTACYGCFHKRILGNLSTENISSYKNYIEHLTDNNKTSAIGITPYSSVWMLLASVVAMEYEKFVLDVDVPASYGYLIDINIRELSVRHHRVYRVPFCESCNRNFEYRHAPWLDAVTLGKDVVVGRE